MIAQQSLICLAITKPILYLSSPFLDAMDRPHDEIEAQK
tara:strand:+ start:87 stop:203 length:117 start_codon:yes stop_codon:yes gene_type:complete